MGGPLIRVLSTVNDNFIVQLEHGRVAGSGEIAGLQLVFARDAAQMEG